ncbi:MAG: hypothetical protein N2315_08840 [Thermanaerothrix sp.]|nr:hypothetical protein [Thermanaerothrix sp.]
MSINYRPSQERGEFHGSYYYMRQGTFFYGEGLKGYVIEGSFADLELDNSASVPSEPLSKAKGVWRGDLMPLTNGVFLTDALVFIVE